MKKRLIAMALALALLTVPAAAFSDVDEGLYYATPIAWAVENGITTGTTETTFSPDTLCTRGQIITFLWRAAGSPVPETESNPYTDVTASMNADFYKAILWAYETGITGNDSSEFHPHAPCDRGTTMCFLWRYAGSPAASAPGEFTDVPPAADYAQAVAWAVEAGITDGTAETTFSPEVPCTRGQIATFLYRCLNETPSSTEVSQPLKVTLPSDPVPEEEPDVRPLRTLTGQGRAYSLGLDGSEFTSEGIYDADVSVDVYSSTEAVFTIQVPFPLFQACSYTVRFEDPEDADVGCMFTRLRWDEAFADIIPWEGEHDQYLFSDAAGNPKNATFSVKQTDDDRMGGLISWHVSILDDEDGFQFDALTNYKLTCEINSNL